MLDDGTEVFEADLCSDCAKAFEITNGRRFGFEEAELLRARGRLPPTVPACHGCVDAWLARPERASDAT